MNTLKCLSLVPALMLLTVAGCIKRSETSDKRLDFPFNPKSFQRDILSVHIVGMKYQ